MTAAREKLYALDRRANRGDVVRLEVPNDRGLVPPHDLDAEAAVLSAMLTHRGALETALDLLRPEHFYSDANRMIFDAARELHAANGNVDAVTIAAELRKDERLAQVGGPGYLIQIADATPAIAHLRDHALAVRDLWRLREFAATCALLRVQAMTGHYESPQDMLNTGATAIDSIATDTSHDVDESLDAALDAALDAEEHAHNEGTSAGVPTGLYDLDRILGPLKPGAVTIIGARTSMGKTSLARHIALRCAHHVEYIVDDRGNRNGWGCGVQYFQMEGKRAEMALDWAHTIGRVDSQAIRYRGHMLPEERARLRWAHDQVKQQPISIDDTPGQTAESIRARARARKAEWAKRRVNLRLVVVDYLQLMETTRARRGANREELVAANSRALKRLAMELDVHVIALSQLSRALEDRAVKDKRPKLTDLRESGAIENDAHNVLLLYRPEYYDEQTDKPGICEVIIEKQRGGCRHITVDVGFEAQYTRFYDIGRQQ